MTAPNAANAAPLMPVCDVCHGAGINEPYRAGEPAQRCYPCNGTGRLRITHEGLPRIIRPGHLGADEQLPAYGWPGGYPLVYLPGTVYPGVGSDDDLINTNSIILCAACATQSLHNPDEWSDEEAMTSVHEDGDQEQNTVCDGCNEVIAYQNWCHDCQDSVDCDEANPVHLCPKTEPYTVRWLETVPSDNWHTSVNTSLFGPDIAKEYAAALRQSGAAFVHVQPSRLPFPPTLEGDL